MTCGAQRTRVPTGSVKVASVRPAGGDPGATVGGVALNRAPGRRPGCPRVQSSEPMTPREFWLLRPWRGRLPPPWSHGTHRRRRGRQAVKDDWAAGNGTRKQPSSEPAPRVQGESEAFSSVSWRVEPRCPEPACRSEPAAPCALFGPRVSSLCRGFPRDQDGSAARSEFVGAVLVTPAQVKALGGDQPAVGFQCRSRCSDRRPCIGVRWPGASERGCHGTREGWGALQTGARGFECGPREDFQGHPSEVCACVWWEWEGQLSNGGKREEVQREPSFNDAGDPKAL